MVQKRIALSASCLKDKLANVRGAVIMAYPMGLPEYDLVRISLDSDDLKVRKIIKRKEGRKIQSVYQQYR